ncbi:hypothetical protein TNCV_1993581 [Trichonephila clavipes]|nr:hypothetical protein TNCV_1993581 [Trichonephila clavipes]
MPVDNVVKKVQQFKVTIIRKRGRPRLRRAGSMGSDFGIISEKTWRTKVNKRSFCRSLQRKALPHEGCPAITRGLLETDFQILNQGQVTLAMSRQLSECKSSRGHSLIPFKIARIAGQELRWSGVISVSGQFLHCSCVLSSCDGALWRLLTNSFGESLGPDDVISIQTSQEETMICRLVNRCIREL